MECARSHCSALAVAGKSVRLNPRMGLFVTMNPGYAGRSNLPDNLKQLFRAIAMIQPDKGLIGQVMLYSQGACSIDSATEATACILSLCLPQVSARLRSCLARSCCCSSSAWIRCASIAVCGCAHWFGSCSCRASRTTTSVCAPSRPCCEAPVASSALPLAVVRALPLSCSLSVILAVG